MKTNFSFGSLPSLKRTIGIERKVPQDTKRLQPKSHTFKRGVTPASCLLTFTTVVSKSLIEKVVTVHFI